MKLPAIGPAVLMCLLVGACSSSAPTSQPEIIIASDLPASAYPGDIIPIEDAIQMAVAEHPKLRGYRLAYVPYDDSLGAAPSPEQGLQNIKSMSADARVLGMVGPHNSYVALEEIPRASTKNLVMISHSVSNACFTVAPLCDADFEAAHANAPINFFRISPRDEVQGTAMANLAADLNVRKVATINMWTGGPVGDGRPYVEDFRRELSARGGMTVLTLDVPRPTHGYSDFLTKAKLAGADAIYAVGDVDGGICDIRAQMGSDFKYLLLTDGVTGQDDCLKGAASAPITFGTYEGVDPTHSSDPATKAVVAKYRRLYPNAANDIYAFAAYDCARILITAIERAIDAKGGGVPTRLEVLRQVASGQFDGGTTGDYKFLPSGDAVSPTMSIWGVKDNHWYYMDRIDASASS